MRCNIAIPQYFGPPGARDFFFFNPRKQRQSYRASIKLARQDKPADRSGATIMNKDREPAIKTR